MVGVRDGPGATAITIATKEAYPRAGSLPRGRGRCVGAVPRPTAQMVGLNVPPPMMRAGRSPSRVRRPLSFGRIAGATRQQRQSVEQPITRGQGTRLV